MPLLSDSLNLDDSAAVRELSQKRVLRCPSRSDSEFAPAAISIVNAHRRDGYRSFLFTSSHGGEGATTVLMGVAEIIARVHELSVLLVELNSLRPAFYRFMHVDPARTLQAAISGKASVATCIRQTPWGGSAIPLTDGRSGIVTSPGKLVRDVLEAHLDAFDLILFDAPPVLESADVVVAGAFVPRVVLIVDSGQTRFEVINRVKRELDAEQIGIFGTVLNKQKRVIPAWLYRFLTK